jgi:hypothetical protein
MLTSVLQRLYLESIVGARKALPFQLRRKGTILPWAVNGAFLIQVEYNRIDEGPSAPIVFNPSDPRADWSTGLVVGDIDPGNVTARGGAYQFSLMVYLTTGAPPIPAARGEFQILSKETPGLVFTAAGAAYDGIPVYAFNGVVAAIGTGLAVSFDPDTGTMVLATNAAPNPVQASHLLLAGIPVDVGGLILPGGNLTLPNWTAAIGTTHLTTSAPYWLGTNGQLTATEPSSPGALQQAIGTATSTTNLLLNIDPNPLTA